MLPTCTINITLLHAIAQGLLPTCIINNTTRLLHTIAHERLPTCYINVSTCYITVSTNLFRAIKSIRIG
jgi:hypothetical protein